MCVSEAATVKVIKSFKIKVPSEFRAFVVKHTHTHPEAYIYMYIYRLKKEVEPKNKRRKSKRDKRKYIYITSLCVCKTTADEKDLCNIASFFKFYLTAPFWCCGCCCCWGLTLLLCNGNSRAQPSTTVVYIKGRGTHLYFSSLYYIPLCLLQIAARALKTKRLGR